MRASFAHAPSPVAVGVIHESCPGDAIAAVRNNEIAGAKALDLHLSCLEDAYRSVESIKSIMDHTNLPILALNYNHRYDRSAYTCPEEERIALLEMGAEAGASAVDMQAYSFNIETKNHFQSELATKEMLFAPKCPDEVALDEETVKKQRTFIEKMHARGTEVLLSCHTHVNLNTEEALSLCRYLAETRKPDVLKLVIPCNNEEELAENFRTMLTLKKEITTCKISFHCSGKKGKVTRFMNPMLGSHLAFCVERYSRSSNPEQMDLRSFLNAVNTLEWRD